MEQVKVTQNKIIKPINSASELVIALFQKLKEFVEKNPTISIQPLISDFKQEHTRFLAEKKLTPVITFKIRTDKLPNPSKRSSNFEKNLDFHSGIRGKNILPKCFNEGVYCYIHDKEKDQLKLILPLLPTEPRDISISFRKSLSGHLQNLNEGYRDLIRADFIQYFELHKDNRIIINNASCFLTMVDISYYNYNENTQSEEERLPDISNVNFPQSNQRNKIFAQLSEADQKLLSSCLTTLHPGIVWFAPPPTEVAADQLTIPPYKKIKSLLEAKRNETINIGSKLITSSTISELSLLNILIDELRSLKFIEQDNIQKFQNLLDEFLKTYKKLRDSDKFQQTGRLIELDKQFSLDTLSREEFFSDLNETEQILLSVYLDKIVPNRSWFKVTQPQVTTTNTSTATDLVLTLFQRIKELVEKDPSVSIQALIVDFEQAHAKLLSEKNLVPVITFQPNIQKIPSTNRKKGHKKFAHNRLKFHNISETDYQLPDCFRRHVYCFKHDESTDKLVLALPLLTAADINSQLRALNKRFSVSLKKTTEYFEYDQNTHIITVNHASEFLKMVDISYYNYNENTQSEEEWLPGINNIIFTQAEQRNKIFAQLSEANRKLLSNCLTKLHPGITWFDSPSEAAIETTTVTPLLRFLVLFQGQVQWREYANMVQLTLTTKNIRYQCNLKKIFMAKTEKTHYFFEEGSQHDVDLIFFNLKLNEQFSKPDKVGILLTENMGMEITNTFINEGQNFTPLQTKIFSKTPTPFS